jgi:hypothetical protein
VIYDSDVCLEAGKLLSRPCLGLVVSASVSMLWSRLGLVTSALPWLKASKPLSYVTISSFITFIHSALFISVFQTFKTNFNLCKAEFVDANQTCLVGVTMHIVFWLPCPDLEHSASGLEQSASALSRLDLGLGCLASALWKLPHLHHWFIINDC